MHATILDHDVLMVPKYPTTTRISVPKIQLNNVLGYLYTYTHTVIKSFYNCTAMAAEVIVCVAIDNFNDSDIIIWLTQWLAPTNYLICFVFLLFDI